MNTTENFSTKFNTNEPLFLYDDTSRNASLIVSKILAVSDNHLFVEAIYVNPEYRQEPQELLINRKGYVIGGEDLLFYIASNDVKFFEREFFEDDDNDEENPSPYEPFTPEIAFLNQLTT